MFPTSELVEQICLEQNVAALQKCLDHVFEYRRSQQHVKLHYIAEIWKRWDESVPVSSKMHLEGVRRIAESVERHRSENPNDASIEELERELLLNVASSHCLVCTREFFKAFGGPESPHSLHDLCRLICVSYPAHDYSTAYDTKAALKASLETPSARRRSQEYHDKHHSPQSELGRCKLSALEKLISEIYKQHPHSSTLHTICSILGIHEPKRDDDHSFAQSLIKQMMELAARLEVEEEHEVKEQEDQFERERQEARKRRILKRKQALRQEHDRTKERIRRFVTLVANQ
jgi:hypothetical protein